MSVEVVSVSSRSFNVIEGNDELDVDVEAGADGGGSSFSFSFSPLSCSVRLRFFANENMFGILLFWLASPIVDIYVERG